MHSRTQNVVSRVSFTTEDAGDVEESAMIAPLAPVTSTAATPRVLDYEIKAVVVAEKF